MPTHLITEDLKDPGIATLTDAASIAWDWSAGDIAQVTLAGNRTLNLPSNAGTGGRAVLVVRQDATGGRTLTLAAGYKIAGGALTLSADPSAVDVLSFVAANPASEIFVIANLNFS